MRGGGGGGGGGRVRGGVGLGGVRVDGNGKLKLLGKLKKKYFFLGGEGSPGGGGDRGVWLGGQGGCERRSKVFVKIQKKKN